MALAAVNDQKTLAELAQQIDGPPNLINPWRMALLASAADMFGAEQAPSDAAIDVTALHAKTGSYLPKIPAILSMAPSFMSRRFEARTDFICHEVVPSSSFAHPLSNMR